MRDSGFLGSKSTCTSTSTEVRSQTVDLSHSSSEDQDQDQDQDQASTCKVQAAKVVDNTSLCPSTETSIVIDRPLNGDVDDTKSFSKISPVDWSQGCVLARIRALRGHLDRT